MDKTLRAEILGALKARPGLGVRELARLTNRPHTSVALALRNLSGARAVRTRKIGTRKEHFLPGPRPPPRVPAELQAILDFVSRHGPVRQKQVKAAFRIARSTVAHRLHRLTAMGFLKEGRHGRSVTYAPMAILDH
ncbi:MAG: hypothetical protein ACYC2H_10390 [Thermoplasmatota archaeon]